MVIVTIFAENDFSRSYHDFPLIYFGFPLIWRRREHRPAEIGANSQYKIVVPSRKIIFRENGEFYHTQYFEKLS